MNADQARAIVHTVTGVPADAPDYALSVAFELGINLIRACQTLDGDMYGGSVDEKLWAPT